MTHRQAWLVKQWMESGKATKSDIRAVVRIIMKGQALAREAGTIKRSEVAAMVEAMLTYSTTRDES
jgi:hypothetical protein